MQSGPIANSLAFIEYDLAIINTEYGPELVVNELLPAVFDVFRESDPVTIASVIFSRSNTLNFRAWSSGNCFSTPSLPTMTAPSPVVTRENHWAIARSATATTEHRPPDCGDPIGQKGHEVRKSTSNSGQMGRIGQKQPEK
jgi:hypothetical protein